MENLNENVMIDNTNHFWGYFEHHPWVMLLFIVIMWTMWIAYKRDTSIIEVWFNGFFRKKSCERCEQLEREEREEDNEKNKPD